MADVRNVELSETAKDVLSYLNDCPGAQDTLEGVASWWLLERNVRRQLDEVEKALRQLQAADLLEKKEVATGPPRFALKHQHLSQIRTLVAPGARSAEGTFSRGVDNG